MLFIQIWVKRSEKIIATETGSVWSPKVLLQDKALLWFTCSGFLASFVSGAFASCTSQYVMVIADGDFAEKVVVVVSSGECCHGGYVYNIPWAAALTWLTSAR